MSLLKTAATFTSGALLTGAFAISGLSPWSASAAPGDVDTTYVPIAPCRVMDTRPGIDNVGPRSTPIGAKETYPLQITGSEGDCVGIPAAATAVAMNVTITNGTAPSFLTLFPADIAAVPLAANLNWLPGAPPTPNKVDVKLSPDGKVNVYNENGTVDVVADVAGYYTASSLTDIQAQLDELRAADLALAANIKAAHPVAVNRKGANQTITNEWTQVVSFPGVSITRTGTVVVFASATAVEFEGGADVQCVITDQLFGFATDNNMRWEAAGTANSEAGEGDAGNVAGTETFNVIAGTVANFYVLCRNLEANVPDNESAVWDPEMTLLFIPNL